MELPTTKVTSVRARKNMIAQARQRRVRLGSTSPSALTKCKEIDASLNMYEVRSVVGRTEYCRATTRQKKAANRITVTQSLCAAATQVGSRRETARLLVAPAIGQKESRSMSYTPQLQSPLPASSPSRGSTADCGSPRAGCDSISFDNSIT